MWVRVGVCYKRATSNGSGEGDSISFPLFFSVINNLQS